MTWLALLLGSVDFQGIMLMTFHTLVSLVL